MGKLSHTLSEFRDLCVTSPRHKFALLENPGVEEVREVKG